MENCLEKCWEVRARVMRHNSGNWPFLMTKAFYIISAMYRQRKEFDKADEFLERSSEVINLKKSLNGDPDRQTSEEVWYVLRSR